MYAHSQCLLQCHRVCPFSAASGRLFCNQQPCYSLYMNTQDNISIRTEKQHGRLAWLTRGNSIHNCTLKHGHTMTGICVSRRALNNFYFQSSCFVLKATWRPAFSHEMTYFVTFQWRIIHSDYQKIID